MIDAGWRRLFRLAVGQRRLDREVDDEIAFHLEMRTRKLVAAGLTADAARAQALRKFGDVGDIRERCLTLDHQTERAMRRANFFDELRRDIAYAFRSLRSQPGFAIVVVLTLALGIGATTAIFSLVDAVLLRPLPVTRPHELVTIGNPTRVSSLSQGSPSADLFSVPLYRDVRDQNRWLSGVLASGRTGRLDARIARETGAGVEHPRGRFVSGNYFAVLGVPAYRGRVFAPAEDRDGSADPVVVISHGYWRRRFALEPSVLGRVIVINDVALTIIGIAPPGFFGEIVGQATDVWIPLGLQPQILPHQSWTNDRDTNWLLLMGRLAPGVTLAQTRAGITQLVRQRLADEAVRSGNPGRVPSAKSEEVPVGSGAKGMSRIRGTFGGPLLTLMAGVLLVLLIVCANVANLMLARGTARRPEIAVRLTLGAGRGRLVRQLLTESTVLALAGGGLGILFAWWGSTTLLRLASGGTPIPIGAALDPRVLGFALAVALGTVFLFGLFPALSSTRVSLAASLKARTRGGTGSSLAGRSGGLGPGKLLVAAQIALSVLLLIGAGLLVRSTHRLQNTDVGYDRESLVMVDLNATENGYSDDRIATLARTLVERLRAIPGVRSVGYSENGLFNGTESVSSLRIDGFVARSEEDSIAAYDHAGPGYFSAVGARVLRGREFTERDAEGGHRVAVINESMARFYFGDRDPLGQYLHIDSLKHEIVGVVADLKDHSLRDDPRRRFYAPYAQRVSSIGSLRFALNVTGDVAPVAAAVRREVAAVDPKLGILEVEPLVELMRASIREDRLLARLASFFGGLALLLAIVGLYGVMTYTIVRRTSEFGLRMALGARPADVLRLVIRESLLLIAVGVVIGLPAALFAARLIRAQLFEVTPLDPVTILAVVGVLALCATVAALIPASRASRVAPLEALRTE